MEKIFDWILENWDKIVALVDRIFEILSEALD